MCPGLCSLPVLGFGLFGAFGVPVNSVSFAFVIVGGMLSRRCPVDHSFLRSFLILIPFIIISERGPLPFQKVVFDFLK